MYTIFENKIIFLFFFSFLYSINQKNPQDLMYIVSKYAQFRVRYKGE